MKMVLAALDFSDATRGVVDEASQLAQVIDAHVVLLHVVRVPRAVPRYSIEPASVLGAQGALEMAAEEQLARIKEDLRTRGVAAHTLRLTGEPAAEIVHQGGKLGVDYLVIGSHGHSALHDLVLGSTTSAVLARSRAVVVVVPPPRRKKKRGGAEAWRRSGKAAPRKTVSA